MIDNIQDSLSKGAEPGGRPPSQGAPHCFPGSRRAISRKRWRNSCTDSSCRVYLGTVKKGALQGFCRGDVRVIQEFTYIDIDIYIYMYTYI